MIIGRGLVTGHLTAEEVTSVTSEGLAELPLDGRRVLVLIPDGTRTMPVPLMYDTFEREIGPRVSALDYLVALGTHAPMDDVQLGRLVGRPVVGGRTDRSRILNHQWNDPTALLELGTI